MILWKYKIITVLSISIQLQEKNYFFFIAALFQHNFLKIKKLHCW